MKKYFVSLAASDPANWEITLEAKNEREAVKQAREAFYNGSREGELVSADMDAELEKGNDGVHVEEIGDDSD